MGTAQAMTSRRRLTFAEIVGLPIYTLASGVFIAAMVGWLSSGRQFCLHLSWQWGGLTVSALVPSVGVAIQRRRNAVPLTAFMMMPIMIIKEILNEPRPASWLECTCFCLVMGAVSLALSFLFANTLQRKKTAPAKANGPMWDADADFAPASGDRHA